MEDPKELSNFRRSVNSKFNKVDDRFNQVDDRFDKVEPKVNEMHDYIIMQKGVEQGRSTLNSNGSINLNKDLIQLLVKLAGIIAALVSVVAASRIIK